KCSTVGGVDVDAPRRLGSCPLVLKARVRRARTTRVEPDDGEGTPSRNWGRAVRVADVVADRAMPVRVTLDEMGEVECRDAAGRDSQAYAAQQHVGRLDSVRGGESRERDAVTDGDPAQRVTRADKIARPPALPQRACRRDAKDHADQKWLSQVEPIDVGESSEQDVVVLRDRS